MAVYEALLLNTAVPQIQAAQAGDSYVMVVNATTPALRITQTGTGNALEVEDSANPDATPFVVLAAGDVGIGTSSPAAKLTVVNTSAGNVVTAMRLSNDSSTTGSGSRIEFHTTDAVFNAIDGVRPTSGSGGELRFLTMSTGGTLTERARITSTGEFQWKPNGTTQAMTLDASGNLVVGATSALKFNTTGSASTRLSTLYSTGTNSATRSEFQIGSAATTSGDIAGLIMFGCGAGTTTSNALANVFAEVTSSSTSVAYGALGFSTANGSGTIERARITSGGYFKVSNSGAYNDSTGAYHELYQSTAGNQVVLATAASASYTGNLCQLGTNTAAGTGFYFIRAFANGVNQFDVRGDGNVTNTNGSYGTISDQKMKTDIVDAGSQWSDIKAMRFRKFKMKDDPSGLVQLGVVAQEVELTSPGLVDEHQDRDAEGNDLGTTTKSVKTSVLLMKAAVALQEAMARIETLEAKIAALEAK
jgi:hypothetical protein